MKFFNVPNIIPASTVMNATINSAPQQILDSSIYSIQIFFTGTPTNVGSVISNTQNCTIEFIVPISGWEG